MDPYSWSWNPEALVAIPAIVAAYVWALRRFPAAPWQIACFAAATVLLLAEGPGLWGLSPILDQQIPGGSMAAAETVVFFAAFAFVFARFFAEQDAAIRARMPRA